MKRVAAQMKLELVLTLRRGESLLVTMAIPVGVLLFFSRIADVAGGLDALVPATVALSVVASAFVSLGIATGFERQSGVLKLLGATPLGRTGLLVAKAAATAVLIVAQVAIVVGTGLALGWRPEGGWAMAAALVLLGAVTFAALGLAVAGTLKAETNLAVANAVFLALLAVGGLVVPADRLPDALAAVARLLPAEPLAAGLKAAFDGSGALLRAVVTLAAWLSAAGVVAARTFRWE